MIAKMEMKRRRKEENWEIVKKAFMIATIGFWYIVAFSIFIGNRYIQEQERKYNVTTTFSSMVKTERLSVKEEVERYMDTLPIPDRTEYPKPRMSIYKEELLIAKQEKMAMEQFLREAITTNPQIGKKVLGMTPSICTMNTSAYCPCIPCCGKEDGQTASEVNAREWHTVAAGGHFKFGTIIYIPSLRDKPNGGWFVVEDRGGAISGNKLDIYFESHEAAIQYGIRSQKCYIFQF